MEETQDHLTPPTLMRLGCQWEARRQEQQLSFVLLASPILRLACCAAGESITVRCSSPRRTRTQNRKRKFLLARGERESSTLCATVCERRPGRQLFVYASATALWAISAGSVSERFASEWQRPQLSCRVSLKPSSRAADDATSVTLSARLFRVRATVSRTLWCVCCASLDLKNLSRRNSFPPPLDDVRKSLGRLIWHVAQVAAGSATRHILLPSPRISFGFPSRSSSLSLAHPHTNTHTLIHLHSLEAKTQLGQLRLNLNHQRANISLLSAHTQKSIHLAD